MLTKLFSRGFSTSGSNYVKVVVCGASGCIGQPMSLLLKTSPLVSKLVLFDIEQVAGVVADLNHVDTKAEVIGLAEPGQLKQAFQDAQVVIVSAGQPRKPGMNRADLFKENAVILKSIVQSFAKVKSEAFLAIISNPVNSLVPFAAEILKKSDAYDPKKLFGITTLDIVRASTFVAQAKGLDPSTVKVPVIGGHSGNTIIPLLSQTEPKVRFAQKELCMMTDKIQNAGTEVVKAKAGKGSAALSMAHAGARFALALCKAAGGEEEEEEEDIVETAYVESDLTEATFFASSLKLGKDGVEENLGYGQLSCFEENLLKEALPELIAEIKTGVEFAACDEE